MILRRTCLGVLLAVLAVVVAPTADAAKRPRKRPYLLRAHVVDFDTGQHPKRRSRQKRFKGYQTHTVEFDVFQRGRAGVERATQVKLFLPNGDLYGAFDVAAFEDETIRKTSRPTATVRVPIAGTMITRYGLYGRWRAEICWAVGSEESCRRALKFVIR